MQFDPELYVGKDGYVREGNQFVSAFAVITISNLFSVISKFVVFSVALFAVILRVPDDFSFNHIDHFFSNVGGVIGKTLDMP